MFIVNQDGSHCEELKKVSYHIVWDDKTQEALTEIYRRRYEKRYNYGSTEKCEAAIKEAQDNYISINKPNKILKLLVNGAPFAIYKNVDWGIEVFNSIINGIGNTDVIKLNLTTQ